MAGHGPLGELTVFQEPTFAFLFYSIAKYPSGTQNAPSSQLQGLLHAMQEFDDGASEKHAVEFTQSKVPRLEVCTNGSVPLTNLLMMSRSVN